MSWRGAITLFFVLNVLAMATARLSEMFDMLPSCQTPCSPSSPIAEKERAVYNLLLPDRMRGSMNRKVGIACSMQASTSMSKLGRNAIAYDF